MSQTDDAVYFWKAVLDLSPEQAGAFSALANRCDRISDELSKTVLVVGELLDYSFHSDDCAMTTNGDSPPCDCGHDEVYEKAIAIWKSAGHGQ